MIIDDEAIEYINQKIQIIEKTYSINVLFWSIRSSFNLGIYRKNSDVDIYFVFTSLDKNLQIIHDLENHYFDLWGCSVEAVKKSIQLNSEYYTYCVTNKLLYKSQYLSIAHKRAGCNYMYSLFFLDGNPYIYDPNNNLIQYFKIELENYDKDILIKQIEYGLDKEIQFQCNSVKNPLNDYLRTLWKVLYLQHIRNNGVPGQYNLKDLIHDYIKNSHDKEFLLEQLYIYQKFALNKNSFSYKNFQIEKLVSKIFFGEEIV